MVRKGSKDMIVDDLQNFGQYIKLNKKFEKVWDFLKENNLNDMPAGRHEIDGSNLYLNIDEYETKETSVPEAHRKYADIQIIINGYEKIGYAPFHTGKTETEYNEERDIEFLYADCEYLKATSGRFFIFYPQDIHQPCISDGEKVHVKKAVFKIKL